VREVAAVHDVETVRRATFAVADVPDSVCAIEHAVPVRAVAVPLRTIIPFAPASPDAFSVRVEAVGLAAMFAATAKVSPVAVVAANETGIETVTVSPTTARPAVGVPIVAGAIAALAAGVTTVVNRPVASAATATSAMRLKDVFVDICILSTSQEQEFPALGLGGKCLLICHERVFFTWVERQCHWYEKSH
jgi:hypothetical protein